MKRLSLPALILLILLTACQLQQPDAAPTQDFTGTTLTAVARASWTAIPVVVAVTPTSTSTATDTPIPTDAPPTSTPTSTNTATSTDTFTPTLTLTASRTPIPTNTRRPTITLTPSLAVTQIDTLAPGVLGGEFTTWTPEPEQRDLTEHFVFQRPIGAGGTNFWARNYSYGSTDGGGRPVHHGLDLQNETGTPVIAAANGIVYYAGSDTEKLFGPQPNFYGNVVVIQHDYKDAAGKPIYTLYGHLYETRIMTGQSVRTGDVIGLVGSEGVALGAHLHFEVRSGDPTSYYATLNPELWIMPFLDYGVLAARVMDIHGNPIPGIMVQAQSSALYRDGYSYEGTSVNGDPEYHENVVIPDLAEGFYRITVKRDEITRFRTVVFIRRGQLSWLNIYLDLPPTPMPE